MNTPDPTPTPPLAPLVPPDPAQCQAMSKNGPFTMGGTIGKWERCTSKPSVIATEAAPGADGRIGSMSLCETCRVIAVRTHGEAHFVFTSVHQAVELHDRARACVDAYEAAVARWRTTPHAPRPIPTPEVTFAAAYLAERVENDLLRTKASITRDAAYVDVVFDGPPDPKAPRFIECEDPNGKSVDAGDWIARPDGTWALRIRIGSAPSPRKKHDAR